MFQKWEEWSKAVTVVESGEKSLLERSWVFQSNCVAIMEWWYSVCGLLSPFIASGVLDCKPPSLVRGLALQDPHVPEKKDEFAHDNHRRDDDAHGGADLDDEPDDEDRRDQEEHADHDGVDALELEDRHVDEVEDQDHDVDHQDDCIENHWVAEAVVGEAAPVPWEAEERAHDYGGDDLEDLDDPSVGLKVASVEVGHFARQ